MSLAPLSGHPVFEGIGGVHSRPRARTQSLSYAGQRETKNKYGDQVLKPYMYHDAHHPGQSGPQKFSQKVCHDGRPVICCRADIVDGRNFLARDCLRLLDGGVVEFF